METPRDPDGSDPALVRLLRRRSRKDRHGRARGGKSYQSWGEYAPRNLHTTSDSSGANMWFYAIMGCAAPLLPIVLFHAAGLRSNARSGYSVGENAIWFAASMIPYILFVAAFAVLLIAGSRLRIWWETRQHSKSRNDTSDPD
ncbi:MAG: hypothetical protein RLO80_06785 [Hyphomonas sp.]